MLVFSVVHHLREPRNRRGCTGDEKARADGCHGARPRRRSADVRACPADTSSRLRVRAAAESLTLPACVAQILMLRLQQRARSGKAFTSSRRNRLTVMYSDERVVDTTFRANCHAATPLPPIKAIDFEDPKLENLFY